MKNQIYKREEVATGLYKVLGADGTILKNHNGKPYPMLSDGASQNLLEDLNDIKLEIKESLTYCVLSTLMEYEEANVELELDIEPQLQWDRLFRLTPGPPYIQIELKNTEKAREFFGDAYVNLQLNYAQSFEEMEELEIDFVPEKTINKIGELVLNLSMAEKVMVNILYNAYDYFSISIPILWVAGKIDDEDFIAIFYALNRQVDIYEMDDMEFEEVRNKTKRLAQLKKLKESYGLKDETLPFVS